MYLYTKKTMNTNSEISKKIHYALYTSDIQKYLNNKVKIVLYSELKNYTHIDQLLKPFNKCVILYQTKKNSGHWTCIYTNDTPNNIYFFDSYGLKVDSEWKFTTKEIKKELQIYMNYLSKLLLESNRDIHFNQYQLQSSKNGYNGCGRWVCYRLKYNKLSVNDFYKLFKNFKNKDLIITLLTYNI